MAKNPNLSCKMAEIPNLLEELLIGIPNLQSSAPSPTNLPQEMAEIPDLPVELLIEIFSRLPTRSVGKCRCLSRLWRSRLSNPQFINLHFNRKTHLESLILVTADKSVHDDKTRTCSINTITLPIGEENNVVLKKIDVPKNWVDVVGSANGLVLMEDKFGHMFLLNPVTTEQVTIPSCDYHKEFQKPCQINGFGYDSSSNDYKIVMLANGRSYCGVSIYSVKTGCWVRKEDLSIYWDFSNRGVLLDGALHWFAKRDEHGALPVIVAFDLISEEFSLVSVPAHTNGDILSSECSVFILKGCLCIIDLDDFGIHAWMMKDYGVQESWTHLILCPTKLTTCLSLTKPLNYSGEDEVLLVDQYRMALFRCNTKEQTAKKVILDNRGLVTDGYVFVESLVSPKYLAISSEREESYK